MKLVNGLGEPVVLRFEAERRQRSVIVKPGGAKTINGMTASSTYSVVVDGCVLTYPDPKFGFTLNYPWYVPDGNGRSQPDYRYSYPVIEELRADGRLYLGVSHGKAGAPDEQAHGFPLSPLSKTCPAR